jgi:predicted molibdopterin-dependent oxidoreductase YjgC
MPGAGAPLRYTAGTAAPLVLGLVRVILDEGLFDEDKTSQLIPDLTGLRTAIRDYDTERVAKLTGLATDAIRETARVLAGAGGVTYLFGEEVLESASAANAASALVALAILTGSVGRTDAGLVPLIQECNAQGANDMGCRPDLLPGYKTVESAAARDHLAKLWGAALPAAPGLGMMPMLQAAAAGQVRALWLMGNNLLKSGGPDGAAEALRRVKLLIVQDLYLNETALAAHVVLPARSYSERQGTFTSIERRVQSIREIVPPPGNTLPDWQILAEVARKMGKDLNLTSPASILREIGQASPLYAGISYDSIGRDGQCWQFPQ